MTKKGNRTKRTVKHNLFRELMSGVQAMREYREGRLTLRTTEVASGTLADFFAASPLRESGLEIERPQDLPRDLDL